MDAAKKEEEKENIPTNEKEMNENGKPATNYILCLDISGSMNEHLLVKKGEEEIDLGYNVLDITKHAIKTIIASSEDNDMLSIVTFNHNATVPLKAKTMDAQGKIKAKDVVENLYASGMTDLHKAINLSME
eukprot:2775792-Rhodomonas_salina.1